MKKANAHRIGLFHERDFSRRKHYAVLLLIAGQCSGVRCADPAGSHGFIPNSLVQQAGHHEAKHGQHAHQAEDVVVALLTREMVEDCAVDDVSEHARCVADQAADTEG